jgi:ABC-2 type transport system ATP-binding protein
MWSYIKNVNESEKMTVFFTTHYMEEAERIADRIAVIDHGKIIASGTSAELTSQTGTSSLEEAFLSLTGRQIREDEASGLDRMRQRRQMFGGRH